MTELVLRGRLVTARLQGDAVVLRRPWGRSETHVPLAAIEAVRTRRRSGPGASGGAKRVTEIVLASASAGSAPVVYTVGSPNAEAARVFASTVTAALPVHDAAEPRADGAELVRTLPRETAGKKEGGRPARVRSRPLLSAGGALFVLGLVPAAAAGRSGPALAVVWAVGYAPFLVLCAVSRVVYRITADWWWLRRRGTTVLATFQKKMYGTGSDGETTVTDVYAYSDALGRERTYVGGGRPVTAEPRRIEVTYDPLDPDRAAARNGPAVRAVQFLAYVVLGLPVVALTAAGPVVYFWFAVSTAAG
ncbi:hypothetical protein [Streptomyces sp. NRRL F-5123]|uniref:hypothetical protein n=1 Tax=Streptomyces sp. NRRL F-5123 TaxID=1463856 RepID=UPI0004E0BA0C|nr:hypothetical protein [Streptomyces sp. NRRL F-5123]